MLISRNFCMLLATAMLVVACERNAATGPPTVSVAHVAPTVPPRPAVASVAAGQPNMTFALVAGSCVEKRCAAEIELVANGQRLDALPLEFAASDAKLVANADQVSFATHAPLATYTAGEEEGAVTTLLQPVRLSAERTGLLVQQAGGFEHVKRRRDLLIVEEKKLKRVWSKQDASGPVRSYADVASTGANIDEIVLIEGASIAPNQADQVTMQRLTWDETAKTLKVTPVPVMAALVFGNFASADAARSKYADPCFAHYWLLRADQIGEKSRRFVLALLAPDAAVPSFQTRPDCATKEARRVAQFRSTPESK
jgi:hypothetical protein